MYIKSNAPDDSGKRCANRSPAWPGFLVAAPFMLLAVWNVWEPASYWLDEILSTLMAMQSWEGMYDRIITDVHPPLYQSILKIWVSIFGDAEPRTRTLSVIFALGAMTVLVVGTRRRPPSFVVPCVLFFGVAWLFPYYAQETRAYALTLLMSTVATVAAVNRIGREDDASRFSWYAILLVLGLSHYFGLAYAGVLLLEDMTRKRAPRAIVERVLVGIALLTWPVIHFSTGGIVDKTGGNFWIASQGVTTTLGIFAESLLSHPTASFYATVEEAYWMASSLALLLLAALFKCAEPLERERFTRLFAIVVGFVAVIAAIDLHTPVSTHRNFIVLLPPVAMLFGFTVYTVWQSYSRSWQRTLIATLVALFAVDTAQRSLARMEDRWKSVQNWKGLAEFVREKHLCEPHCWFVGEEWKAPWFVYYFRDSMGQEPGQVVRTVAELGDAERVALPIIGAHPIDADELDRLRGQFQDWQCVEPEQSWKGYVYLLAPPGVEVKGLDPCQ